MASGSTALSMANDTAVIESAKDPGRDDSLVFGNREFGDGAHTSIITV
jgi:hypothetical protein